MKAASGDPARGRVDWRRFALAVTVPTVVAGAIVAGMANGAIAAQITVAGKPFKVSASLLDGEGFTQYGSKVELIGGKKVDVATSGIRSAKLYDLCQSVRVSDNVSLVIRAGEGEGAPAEATNLLINMTELRGKATFKDIQIGRDASTLNGDGLENHGAAGSFGQQADTVKIENLRQVSQFTSAGSFTLTGLRLQVRISDDGKPEECFHDDQVGAQ